MRTLVTGATGYIGSRLVGALRAAGHDVVATARDTGRLRAVGFGDGVARAALDVTSRESCRQALAGETPFDVAYYLVHTIGAEDFGRRDRDAARTFAETARDAGVRRIVYLGGFVPDGESLSDHLDSRAEVGEVLQQSGVDTVWLRAGVVLGAGSTSYELIRYLADRLPVVPTPAWMNHLVSPIAVNDVLHYLVAVADPGAVPAGAYDIAGDDPMPYRDLFGLYIRAVALRRALLPVRGISTQMAAPVISRLTPVPTALAADLVGSLDNTMISADRVAGPGARPAGRPDGRGRGDAPGQRRLSGRLATRGRRRV